MFGIGDYPPRHLHYPRHVSVCSMEDFIQAR